MTEIKSIISNLNITFNSKTNKLTLSYTSNFTLNELGSVSNSNSIRPVAINISNRKTMKHEQPIVQHITLQGSFAIFFICQGMTGSIGEEIISP